jgi:SAM-dependent methyltransferase
MQQPALKSDPFIAEWTGFCPICQQAVTFRARDSWFRDHLLCTGCDSIPRERAMVVVLNSEWPDWRSLRIHESSPVDRGISRLLRLNCRGYQPTQFFPGIALGTTHNNCRCEDLERQTFKDGSLDLVITQDVMEHVFDPAAAYREIHRTLRPGGAYIHTTPIYKDRTESIRCAELLADGSVRHLMEPEYHGNPVDPNGSLVTFRWGYDLADRIAEWTPFDVEVRRFHDRRHGIVAEFSEVIICRKR